MAGNMNRELRGYQDFLKGPKPHEASLSEAEARHLRHGYYASVSYTDAQIGRLLRALDDNGLRDNTIVVLWGDHGWKLGEHNGWGKMTNYEVDARVPLIVRAPGYRSGQCQGMVEFVDVYPTLCELAGIARAPELEGQSFVPLLENPRRKGKAAVFHQFLREGIWVAPDGVEYMGYAIRTERHRYVEWRRWKDNTLAGRELYDLVEDPQENLNRVEEPGKAALVAELSRRLQKGWRG
jgi:arylsulfatase A-like enzyme